MLMLVDIVHGMIYPLEPRCDEFYRPLYTKNPRNLVEFGQNATVATKLPEDKW